MEITPTELEKMTNQPSLLNWDAAAVLAGQLAPAGPKISPAQMRAAVEEMRYLAHAAVDQVYSITGLDAARDLHDAQVLIVDRASWAKANAQSFAVMFDPMGESLMGTKFSQLSPLQSQLVTKTATAELAGVLAYLSTRVLGQYDPYAALAGYGAEGGRLLVLAPNLLSLEQELKVDSKDFRLWVCLHEQTHRVQFAAAPWLRQYLLDLMLEFAANLGDETEGLMGRAITAAVVAQDKPETAGEKARGAELMLNDAARQTVSRITAIMSLLEGHANAVMDAVDPTVIPSVKTIRQRFNRRSETQKFLTKFMTKFLGLDRKLKQYKNGQKFVQYIITEQGMHSFNRIWQQPENLPSEHEIHHPQLWIDRVLGQGHSRPDQQPDLDR